MAGADGFPGIPWKVDQVATDITGYTLGDRFVDERGRIFILWQIDPALINNATASGEVGVLKASHVWTNDVSDSLIDSTSPIFAGVALGAHAESTSGGTTRYALFLVKGRCTLTTTDGNVAAGDQLCLNTSVDGGVIEIDETSTALTGNRMIAEYVGVALADDDGNNDVNAYVASQIFG
jgi:hypothetical protein